ncbi:MAG: dihydropteroate synthase [Bacteroidota bacterium]|nr:dihydropteroate synthase [Bacteroidota bacterium]
MGILNITPDSFYDGAKYTSQPEILTRVGEMIEEGVDFVDLGAYSSRPGAGMISEEEELSRLEPSISIIRKEFPDLFLSIDTFRSGVARRMVRDFGADIINDISAGTLDSKMFETMADLNVPYIIMHMQGNPQNMQDHPKYEDLVKDIMKFLAQKMHELNLLGVKDIIVDPGFGFGKTLDHNYKILSDLDAFALLEVPVMVGISRKSMISGLLQVDSEDSLIGTSAAHSYALMKGVDILRVHDVKAAKETIKIIQKIQGGELNR